MTLDSDFAKRLQVAVKKLRTNLKTSKEGYQKIKNNLELKQNNLNNRMIEIDMLENQIEIKNESIQVLNAMSKVFEETSIRRKVEEILHQIMLTIFQEDCRFRFVRRTIRKQQEIHIYQVKIEDGVEFLVPISSAPGGVRDIVDTVMRILILKQFPVEKRLLAVDEPMKNLSKDMQADYFKFVKRLCDEFDIQQIINTHEAAYISELDNIYHFSNDGIKTSVMKGEQD